MTSTLEHISAVARTVRPVRAAVVWPRPRRDRWRLGESSPDQYPDQSDALLHLEQEGFTLHVEDPLPFPWNPFARSHEFWSGLDPLRAARVAARSTRYDVILGVGDAVAHYLVQLRRAGLLSSKIVLIDPALASHYPRRKRVQDLVLPRVDQVIVFGRVQLDYLQDEYGGTVKADFIHHRADTRFFRPQPHPSADAIPLVLSVGNDPSRDFETLLAAVDATPQAAAGGIRFLIHSSRPVETRGRPVEVKTARLPWIGLRDLYARASVVVLPLSDVIHAGGINTLLEAMCMARPVVVSDSRGLRDYVVDGQTALIVPPGDAGALANAVRRLVGDPDLASQLARNGRQFVEQHCRSEQYAARLAERVRGLLAV
jgi:glycosyltransferase involved in cell wall biosynthesis